MTLFRCFATSIPLSYTFIESTSEDDKLPSRQTITCAPSSDPLPLSTFATSRSPFCLIPLFRASSQSLISTAITTHLNLTFTSAPPSAFRQSDFSLRPFLHLGLQEYKLSDLQVFAYPSINPSYIHAPSLSASITFFLRH